MQNNNIVLLIALEVNKLLIWKLIIKIQNIFEEENTMKKKLTIIIVSMMVCLFLVQMGIDTCTCGAETIYSQFTANNICGFATLNGGTTGGAGGVVKRFNSFEELQAYFKLRESNNPSKRIDEKVIIYIDGYMEGASKKLDIKNTQDVSIIGINNANINFMLNVVRSSNIIIQNITFEDCSYDDAINIDESTNVWVDHCTLCNAKDGLLDVKNGSDFVTISWCHFKNHRKTSLVGHSKNNRDKDKGKLKVTYCYNWFDGTYSRHPRVRYGQVHVFNNFFDNLGSYGVASTCEAEVLVEGNYFLNVKYPIIYPEVGTEVASILSNDPIGKIKGVNNKFINCGESYLNDKDFTFVPPYAYEIFSTNEIPDLIKTGAGAEKTIDSEKPNEPETPGENLKIVFKDDYIGATTNNLFTSEYMVLPVDGKKPMYIKKGGTISANSGFVTLGTESGGRMTIGALSNTNSTSNSTPGGVFDLSKEYEVIIKVSAVDGNLTKKFQVYVDNNTTSANNSIHGSNSRIYDKKLDEVETGEITIKSNIGTKNSFIQLRVESGGLIKIDEVVIRYTS